MAQLVVELATGHGGDLALAEDMIAAAADAGAHFVKTQAYSLEKLNPRDPQADWLRQSHLDQRAHERLIRKAEACRVTYMSTPFDRAALDMLSSMDVWAIKIASTEARSLWWDGVRPHVISWPWGMCADRTEAYINLSAVPLYPTPIETLYRLELLDGLSDHCEGIDACLWALARGAKMVEVHMCLPGRSREMPFDKRPGEIRMIRDFADTVESIATGVSQQFRDRYRWRA